MQCNVTSAQLHPTRPRRRHTPSLFPYCCGTAILGGARGPHHPLHTSWRSEGPHISVHRRSRLGTAPPRVAACSPGARPGAHLAGRRQSGFSAAMAGGVPGGAHDRARRAHGAHEVGDAPACLLPELWSGAPVVRLGIIRVAELVQNDALPLRLQLLCAVPRRLHRAGGTSMSSAPYARMDARRSSLMLLGMIRRSL